MTFDPSSGLASRRLRVLVDPTLRELGECSSVFFSSPSVVSRSFTAWFKPSSAAHVF